MIVLFCYVSNFFVRKGVFPCGRKNLKHNKKELSSRHFRILITVLSWQGHKDLNPEPTVLETAALPIELYPYILYLQALAEFPGGPSGTRTRDYPVMSRML